MPRKKTSRGKRKPSRRGRSWRLPLALAALPVIAFLCAGFYLLQRPTLTVPNPPAFQPDSIKGNRTYPPSGGASGSSKLPATPSTEEPVPRTDPALLSTSAPAKPRLAIIMDDLGRDLASARALLDIDLPVALAILPGETQSSRVAKLAHLQGREVLLHIPMEPQGYPLVDPGDDALLVEQHPEEIRRRVRNYLRQVPHATGANNHMGSRFTENAEGLAIVFEELQRNNLFFVDSVTSSKSVALSGARRFGLRAIGRDIFLDNVQEVERIAAEIRKLVAVAEKRGQAVGICHPYPQTMAALRQEALFLRERVEVVPVSRLLRP